jgi:hypothetical protein
VLNAKLTSVLSDPWMLLEANKLGAVVRGDPAQQSAKCGMAAKASGENYFTWRIETGSPNVSSRASKRFGH